MQPLDLQFRPPRGPRERLAGLAFMPRTIDKLRAEMPGGSIAPYLNDSNGVSNYMCKRVGLDMEDLRAAVVQAADEDEVEVWLRARLDPAAVEEANRKLETLTIERLTPETLALVKRNHPIMEQRPELVTFFEIFEADDAATYPDP
ncbi:MAG TPA: DUF5069 domain-containing protein [Candidatus Elarobacter sp.]|jgi:hypothetical protein|nr:DUF5069 domain-containing protein [Candidatus Elarobacter sp.]